MELNLNSLSEMFGKIFSPPSGAAKQRADDGSIFRVLAQVVDVKGDKVFLQSAGGKFSAQLEAQITKGEYLLLEYYSQRGEQHIYRILARTNLAPQQSGNPTQSSMPTAESLLWTFFVSLPEYEMKYPVLLRYYPPPQKGRGYKNQQRTLLELTVETKNLGLVMIKIGTRNNNFECTFMVEDEKIGHILEEEAQDLLEEDEEKRSSSKKLITWQVYPVREKIAESMSKDNILLDTQV